MSKPEAPKGNEKRDAVASLGGYVYQIYQAALSWLELNDSEFLFLEVAEDFAVAARDALNAVQVKGTSNTVTINSDEIVASIDSFVELRTKNPQLLIRLRHLTTSKIGKEKSASDRIGNIPTLEMWRSVARTGDVAAFRNILLGSKLSKQTKDFIRSLSDAEFREEFLKRIHFDCGALELKYLKLQLQAKVVSLLRDRGGVTSQANGCLHRILLNILERSTEQTDRFVDRASLENLLEAATHVAVNRAQLEHQNELIAKALSTSIPSPNGLVSSRFSRPSPVNEVPLPAGIAARTAIVSSIVSSLEEYGVSWILGSSGVGKTIAARLAALRESGNWASVNLRGLSIEQVSELLLATSEFVAEETNAHGLLIDDLECPIEPHVAEKLLNLLSICKRRDLLLLITAPRASPSDLLFVAGLPTTIQTSVGDFTQDDLQQILSTLGVNEKYWTEYIHVVSGGGHPQLAVATIQSMQRAGWDTNEFTTLNALLVGSSEVQEVRRRTRERLLQELPEGSRKLLERISLAMRGFKRELVLDLAQVSPSIPDAGLLFDQFIGTWIDQHERDSYSLSPLLTNFAQSTLTEDQKRRINFEIANSLTKPRTINPLEANSAMLAAWLGKNEEVLLKLSLAVVGTDTSDLGAIAPHLLFLKFLTTHEFAYRDSPTISQVMRGAQLLVLCFDDKTSDRYSLALSCFETEIDRAPNPSAGATMALLVYSKLLLSEPNFGPLPQFWNMVSKLHRLLENRDGNLPRTIVEELAEVSTSIQAVGFMFLVQARQLRKIDALVSAFEFLDSCDVDFRAMIFDLYGKQETLVDIDLLISGAWLKEHEANTIDPKSHSAAYARMEHLAKGWKRLDLAAACRKYQAIIVDEYGNDKNSALSILDNGLALYGSTNSELIRAKAKVLYRANNHQASLELSRWLIEGEAPLGETEKAFLGREAAISAEKQADFQTAQRFYLFGANAAEDCGLPDMIPMHIGLLADAALASWHAGDRETCLRGMIVVLDKLSRLDPKSSLRAAHCHSVARHTLLWLEREITGDPRYTIKGEQPRIYPGLVSNPEPHADIGKRFLAPLEIAWYMLAKVENESLLDVGVTENISTHLPKGPVREGLVLLTRGRLYRAFHTRDLELFLSALADTIAEFALANKLGGKEKVFNIENITYGRFPEPTGGEIDALVTISQQQILSFAATCLLNRDTAIYDNLLNSIGSPVGFATSQELMECLAGKANDIDYYSRYAGLLSEWRNTLNSSTPLLPTQVLELTLKLVQTAKLADQSYFLSKLALDWLRERWNFICEKQRFLLSQLSLFEKHISDAWARNEPDPMLKILNVLLAILPTLGIPNQGEVKRVIENLINPDR